MTPPSVDPAVDTDRVISGSRKTAPIEPDVKCVQSVGCVVVTYNPDQQLLRAQTLALKPQVAAIVWVDNGSHHSLGGLASELGVQLVGFDHNRGVAHAQNEGLALIWAMGCDAGLLMDHDSLPAPDMVAQLLRVMNQVPSAAAVGSHYSDPRSGGVSSPFVWVDGLSLRRLTRDSQASYAEVDHLIASGCLIRQQAWQSVGGMHSELFVDFVDVEWCLRARHAGWCVLGAWDAQMEHTIGHDLVRCFGRNFRVHGPSRLYFHVRNGIALYRQRWIPWRWRCVSAYRLGLKMGFYLVCGPNRLAYLKTMLAGIRDGLSLRLR
ncbi:MAG: glycosyltransferase family 2 protein [Polaromonas sp.]|nr:glycosyltransferase family 2 protein [Polaromonas sp.]